MYYKFTAYKNDIEYEKYTIDVFDRNKRDYYTKQYRYYVQIGIFDRFTVTSCYDDNAIKNTAEYKY